MPPAVQLGVLRRSHLRGPTMPCRPSTRQDDHASRTPDALFPLLRLVLAGAAARLTWPRRSAPRGIRWQATRGSSTGGGDPACAGLEGVVRRGWPTGRAARGRHVQDRVAAPAVGNQHRWAAASRGRRDRLLGWLCALRVRADDGHGRHLPAPERVAAGHRCLPQARHSHRRDPQPHARNTSPELIFCHFSAEGDAMELAQAIKVVWSPLRAK